MHILLIHQYYCPSGGGGNDRSRAFAQYFSRQGHKVSVLTSQAKFPVESQSKQVFTYNDAGVEVTAIPLPDPHMQGYWTRIYTYWSFMQACKRISRKLPKPDCIYACSTPLTAAEAGRIIARKFQVPFIFEVQDVWPDVAYGMGIIRNRGFKYILDWATRRLYQQADHIIALSEDMLPQIQRLADVKSKISVFPNGTDIHLFQPLTREKSLADRIEFVYAGTVGRANDVQQLTDALRILKNKNRKNIYLRIIGRGNRYLQVKRSSEDLSDMIVWHPPVSKSEVANLLAQSDIGVVCFAPYPALESNSANKFFDYLASGLPVLINYGGWQAKVLEENACGMSVPAGNPEALAQAMEVLADDVEKRKEMGINARKLAVLKYDRTLLAQEVLEVIQSL